MKRLFFLCLFGVALSQAQSLERQVIGSSGTSFSNATAQVDFTVGELVVTTITDGTTELTQGFQQTNLSLLLRVSPIVFLQGSSINPNVGEETLMRDDLRVGGIIPLTSPYADGLTTVASVFTSTGTDAIVDWVWVELRNAADNTIVEATRSALLQRDGNIVDVDGVSAIEFDGLASGNYFVSVNHRNHLGIMSAVSIALSRTTTSLDLITDSNDVLGGTNAVIPVGGRNTMIGGDYDENGQVQTADVNAVILLLGGAGYDNGDYDMNGQIQTTDINAINYPNIGRGQQF